MQLGQSDSEEFVKFKLGLTAGSSKNTWPTQDNPTMYKFNSLWLELMPELTRYERSTYSFLDWLGDVGGLFEGLTRFFMILVGPLAAFAMKAEVLS